MQGVGVKNVKREKEESTSQGHPDETESAANDFLRNGLDSSAHEIKVRKAYREAQILSLQQKEIEDDSGQSESRQLSGEEVLNLNPDANPQEPSPEGFSNSQSKFLEESVAGGNELLRPEKNSELLTLDSFSHESIGEAKGQKGSRRHFRGILETALVKGDSCEDCLMACKKQSVNLKKFSLVPREPSLRMAEMAEKASEFWSGESIKSTPQQCPSDPSFQSAFEHPASTTADDANTTISKNALSTCYGTGESSIPPRKTVSLSTTTAIQRPCNTFHSHAQLSSEDIKETLGPNASSLDRSELEDGALTDKDLDESDSCVGRIESMTQMPIAHRSYHTDSLDLTLPAQFNTHNPLSPAISPSNQSSAEGRRRRAGNASAGANPSHGKHAIDHTTVTTPTHSIDVHTGICEGLGNSAFNDREKDTNKVRLEVRCGETLYACRVPSARAARLAAALEAAVGRAWDWGPSPSGLERNPSVAFDDSIRRRSSGYDSDQASGGHPNRQLQWEMEKSAAENNDSSCHVGYALDEV